MRALAIALVIGEHAAATYRGGWLGVDVFFVLSGFLITTLLMSEAQRTNRVSLRGFYARRGLRLLPALAVAVVMAVVLAATVAPHVWRNPTFEGVPWVIFYVGDFGRALAQNDYGLGLLQHCWSLAVEEQFYLVWPFVTILLVRAWPQRLRSAALVAILAAVALVLNAALVNHHYNLAYFTPVGHSTGLLVGSALAFAMSDARTERLARSRAVTLAAWCALCVIIVASFKLEIFGHEETAGIAITSVGTATVIASVIAHGQSRLSRVLSLAPLTWLGQRSYGLYLYHYIIFRALFPRVGASGTGGAGTASIPLILVAVGVSLVAAEISFRLIERPCLKLKDRFTHERLIEAPVAAAVAAGGVETAEPAAIDTAQVAAV